MSGLTKHFRDTATPLMAAEQKIVARAVLSARPHDEVHETWGLFAGVGDPDWEALADAVLLLSA